jgi:hypothetical protein
MSRVLACADVYDALTAKRPYRDPMSSDDALALMRRDVGAAFFPEPFAALCADVDAHPLAAQLIWIEVCQAACFEARVLRVFLFAAGGARRLVSTRCVAADMRGSGPHDRVCELRSGAAV